MAWLVVEEAELENVLYIFLIMYFYEIIPSEEEPQVPFVCRRICRCICRPKSRDNIKWDS